MDITKPVIAIIGVVGYYAMPTIINTVMTLDLNGWACVAGIVAVVTTTALNLLNN